MKPIMLLCLLLSGLLGAQEVDPAIAEFMEKYSKHDSYKKIEFRTLKASKDELESRNTKVYYEGRYLGFTDAFPEYIEDSGFKPSRYFMIGVVSTNVPVLIKKNKDYEALFAKLKNGAVVRVYGRLEDFRKKPHRAMMPDYYFKVAHLRVLSPEPAASKTPNEKPRRRPIRPFRR